MATFFPEWIAPMAATLTQERFTGPEWIFERKLDGIRLLAFKHGPNVRLLSRNRLPQNVSYPSLVDAVANLPVDDVILDGEATGVWGPSTLRQAQGRPEQGRGTTSPGVGEECKVAYHVFDILWLKGRDVSSLPLDARRARCAPCRYDRP